MAKYISFFRNNINAKQSLYEYVSSSVSEVT